MQRILPGNRRRAAQPSRAPVTGHRRNWPGLGLLSTLCLLGSVLLLMSCQKGEIAPVEITPEDMCANCRMAISEKRYAAEFIDRDGEAFKFDDIGCMNNFIKARQTSGRIAAYFVTDFESRQWVKAEDAYYVSSPELKSPMSGNIAAFNDEAKAQQAVAKFQGKLLRFNDIFQR